MCKKLAHSSCPLPGVPYCFPYNSNKRRASCVSNINNTSSMYDQNHGYNFYICTECIKNNKTTNNKTVSSVGAPGSKGTSIGGNAEMTSISTSAASRTSAAIGRSASNNKATSIHITSARSSNTSGTEPLRFPALAYAVNRFASAVKKKWTKGTICFDLDRRHGHIVGKCQW